MKANLVFSASPVLSRIRFLPRKIGSFLIPIIKLAVAVGLIAWLVTSGKLNLSAISGLISPVHLAVGGVLMAASLLVAHTRWWLLLKTQGFAVAWSSSLRLSAMGWFFNTAVPGSVGGDLFKAIGIARGNPGRRVRAATTVIMDRYLGLMGMAFLALVAVAAQPHLLRNHAILLSLSGAVFGLALFMFVLLAVGLSETWHQWSALNNVLLKLPGGAKILEFKNSVYQYRHVQPTLWGCVLLSWLAQALTLTVFAYVGMLMGEAHSLASYFFAGPLGFIVMSVPIAPGGLGVGQVAFLKLLSWTVGYETQVGVVGITFVQLLQLGSAVIGALVYMRSGKHVG